jgi:hypothetical protein
MSKPKSPVPQLLYHNLLAPLYPSNTSDNVLTIRFPTAVRVESLRIAPEGVETLSGIGSTYPNTFSARVLFNTSPSNPVNALSSTSIAFDGRVGCEQDYLVGMPEGVATRMMVLTGGFERLSLSIYGYAAINASTAAGLETKQEPDLTERHTLEGREKEDWSWVSGWAGGVDGLLRLLDEDVSRETRERALSCLELLSDTPLGPAILTQLLDHPTALSYLLLLPSYPPQPLLQRLFSGPRYALHHNLRHHLPPHHRVRNLVHGSEESRRNAAWEILPNEGGLRMLEELGIGDLSLEDKASGLSRIARLVQVLEQWKGPAEAFEIGLDLLLGGIDGSWTSYLARRVPPLIVTSNIKGSSRDLKTPDHFSRDVLTSLLGIAPLIDDTATFEIVSKLALRYAGNLSPTDPLVTAFHTPPIPPTPSDPATANARQVYRFSQALHSSPNALVHSLTPNQILEALAPDLLASLATAREPMFGLSSSNGAPGHQDASASAFAGKVYSSHEFRSRPNPSVNLAILAGSGSEPGTGLGVGNARMESRPASRHVDDYLAR